MAVSNAQQLQQLFGQATSQPFNAYSSQWRTHLPLQRWRMQSPASAVP